MRDLLTNIPVWAVLIWVVAIWVARRVDKPVRDDYRKDWVNKPEGEG